MNLKTGLFVMMPPEVQAMALPLIKRYAPRMLKYYPAHLTILFPFVGYPVLGRGIERLSEVCAGIEPFMMTLSGYKFFPNVAYIAPEPEAEIQSVLRTVHAAFPEAPPYGGVFDDVHPHVTVGLFDNEEEKAAAVLPEYPPLTVRVDRFHVMYGSHDAEDAAPWVTQAIISLGRR